MMVSRREQEHVICLKQIVIVFFCKEPLSVFYIYKIMKF